MIYFDIAGTFEKVDFSPIATAYLQRIIEDSSPDAFTQDQRDNAVLLAQTYGHQEYDGRWDPVAEDWEEEV